MTERNDRGVELRRRAEYVMREGADGARGAPEEGQDAMRLVHELRVYQIELELQNEELRESRTKAEESLRQYLDLYEYAPVPYLTLDRAGTILRANIASESSLCVERSRLIGRPLADRLAPGDRPALAGFLASVNASGCRESFESPIRKANGEKLIAQVIGFGCSAKNGECRLALIDITDRERAREALDRAAREKELLMRELQHRVKNSLNVVYSLLSLGESQVEDAKAKEVIEKARARLMAMSHIYEELYNSGEVLTVDLKSYLEQLIRPLLESYAVDSSRLRLVAEFDSVKLDAQRAALAGLILSELISNATKYAYLPGSSGELRVSLLEREGLVELRVSDDGPGLDPGFDPSTTDSMGFCILRMLCDQMRAEMKVLSSPGSGVTVSVFINP
jgi:two-component system, sensor histidine kinase PdtaS